MLSPDRRRKIEETYELMRPMIQFLGRFRTGGTLLDVGSGEGVLSLKIAEDLQARRIILVDNTDRPAVDLPPHAEFHLIDVQSEEFVRRFQNKVDVVVCQCVLHEVTGLCATISNLIQILPISGVGLILDYSEQGWAHQRAIAAAGEEQCPGHFVEDMRRVRFVSQQLGLKLDTDLGIRTFWESLFSRLPGECHLTFNGDVYTVLYIPRQWGEVKEPPPDIKRMLKLHNR